MCSMRILIRNMKHLEKEPQILNVVSITIIMDRKPINSMSGWVLIPHNPIIHPTRDQNRRSETSRSLRRHKTKLIVPIHVFLFHFIKVFHSSQSEFFQIFFDFGCVCEIRNVAWFRFTFEVGWDEVIGFS